MRGLSNKYCLLTFFINFGYHVNFKDFYTKLSQMKDTKHIRRELIMSPESCPRRGLWGAQGVNLFFKVCHVAYQIDGDDEQNRMQVQIFILGSNW